MKLFLSSILITIFTALSLLSVSAQIRWDKLEVVKEADPIIPTLKKWQQSLAAKYQKGGVAVPAFSSSYELPFQSLKTLFPDHRFFAMSWSEKLVEGKEKEAVGLAHGLGVTLVCDAQGSVIKELAHSGNYLPPVHFFPQEACPQNRLSCREL